MPRCCQTSFPVRALSANTPRPPTLMYRGRVRVRARRRGGEVDEAGHDRRRAVDLARRRPAPDRIAGRRVEGAELPVVRSDVDAIAPHRCRGVDVRPRVLRPEEVAGLRAEGVERPVGVADVHAAVRDGRRRIEVLAPPEPGERASPPAQRARPGIQRVHVPVVRTDVDRPVRVRRRAVDLLARVVRPTDPAVLAG